MARHPNLARAAGRFASLRGRGSRGSAISDWWAAGRLPDGDHQSEGIAFFLGLFAAAVPAATPLWAKLTVLSAGGMIEVAWYAAVSFVLSAGPMRAGYQNVRRTPLIAAGLRVALDAR
jgi:hypothetical protein